MTITHVLIFYLVIVNVIDFILMGADKRKAVRGAWRIPEATLFLFALIGGSLGGILGMHFFHHKTKHWYFKWGMPAILAAHLVLYWLVRGILLDFRLL